FRSDPSLLSGTEAVAGPRGYLLAPSEPRDVRERAHEPEPGEKRVDERRQKEEEQAGGDAEGTDPVRLGVVQDAGRSLEEQERDRGMHDPAQVAVGPTVTEPKVEPDRQHEA